MANKTALVLGIGLIFAGLFAFAIPGFAGMDLGAARAAAVIVAGIVAFGFGLLGSPGTAKIFCIAFGAAGLLLGLAGFAYVLLGAAFLAGGVTTKSAPAAEPRTA